MRVNVTDEHISGGIRGSYSSCPIALAIRDKVSDSRKDEVDVGRLYVSLPADDEPSVIEDYRLSIEACNFIEDYDRGRLVEPFEFELGEPRPVPHVFFDD